MSAADTMACMVDQPEPIALPERRRLQRWIAAVGLLSTAEERRTADVPETNAMALLSPSIFAAPIRRRIGRYARAIVCISVTAMLGASCAPVEIPISTQSVLTALAANGFVCQDPRIDNVPSGLTQWSCEGKLAGAEATVLVDGDAQGVFVVTTTITRRIPRQDQVKAFLDLLRVTHVSGDHEAEFGQWLEAWDGSDRNVEFGRAGGRLFGGDTPATFEIRPGPRRSVANPG